MSVIELEDLSKVSEPDEQKKEVYDKKDSVIYPWAFAGASLLLVYSCCLIFFPRIILFVSETSSQRRAVLTPLESYLALHFGIWLSAVASVLIINIPSASPAIPVGQPSATHTHVLLVPVTSAGILTSFLSYNTKEVGLLASVVFLGAGTIGLWGLWVIVFGASAAISKTTGADKRTSAFLFGNKSAASVQKKQWKKEEKGKGKDL